MLKYQIVTSPERNRYSCVAQTGFIVESQVGVVGDTGKYYQTWVQLVLVPVYNITCFCTQLSYRCFFVGRVPLYVSPFGYNTNTSTS